MSESLQFKGTPGEWFAAGNDIYTRTEIVACCMVADKTDDQAKANAKLISAAPELLQACIEMKAAFDNAPSDWLQTDAVNKAETLMVSGIKKALS